MRHFVDILLGLLLVAGSGRPCDARQLTAKEAKSPPRARVACLPNPTLGTRYYDTNDLGQHMYSFHFGVAERDGIVYTCRGGHVDVTHVRKAADWAAYLAYHCRETLLNNGTQVSFKMREPSRYHLRFQYPPGWRRLPEATRRQIADEVSIQVGQYLGYLGSVWHEVLTWYGFKASGVYPEFQSAFSWEDNYSNALGAYIGGLALRDRDREYSDAVTYYIDRELRSLRVQSRETAEQAAEDVRGLWYTGGFFTCDMIKRHLDIGLNDGVVTPWLIPGVAGCRDVTPSPCPVPTLALLGKYGFHVTVEIELREWEKDKILQAVYPGPNHRETRIEPVRDLPAIMKELRATVIQRYGLHADEAGLAPAHPNVPQTTTIEDESSEVGPGTNSQKKEPRSLAPSAVRPPVGGGS